ncbi:tetraacyldisaccharide 4'-kinase [Roseospirillum parvum]|uniref:Tetraacyldisaccharide 4'-kinase n=1 Tax=Roseospirillum parvum TaxID=83401 RepID=A0A1G7UKF4_9PROT|nr:tetraacyldisaccharide 4'-kinase [Roseospirillum parvum]SDG47973.1 tetraacyldisaccharide 4'-kinase [Roseospirillum parvum]
MKAPPFWRADGPLPRLLGPLGGLYTLGGWLRRRGARPARAGVPVLCVGNLTAGGAGKTPIALDLGRRLQGRGRTVAFLTRGHGGQARGPLRVDPARHDAEAVGDEALLLAEVAMTVLSADRAAGAALAEELGAEVIVMDDGHQNPGLIKDLSLVVIDGVFGFGNHRVIPAGPLREPWKAGLARADAVVVVGPDRHRLHARLSPRRPRLTAHFQPGPQIAALLGRPVVAFAGIGRPDKFFDGLAEAGVRVVARHPFADHFPYRPTDIQPILDEAFALGAAVATTAKDAVRLPADQRQQVNVIGLSVDWPAPVAVEALLDDLFARFKESRLP